MISKKQSRLRRVRRGRGKIVGLGIHRLSVFKSNQHIYAQVFSQDNATVIASASTLDKDLRSAKNNSNVDAAKKVGASIAKRAKAKGIEKVAFDRSGFKYHGRVQALAEAARESGLQF